MRLNIFSYNSGNWIFEFDKEYRVKKCKDHVKHGPFLIFEL